MAHMQSSESNNSHIPSPSHQQHLDGSTDQSKFDSSIIPHSVEVNAVPENLHSLRITNKNGCKTSEHHSVPVNSSNSSQDLFVVFNMKKKIADLCAEVESLRCEHSQAIERQSDLEQEITSLKRSKTWYSEQLRQLQSSTVVTSASSSEMTNLLAQTESANHKLNHENACLQAQLACSRAALIDAKRGMSHQLETIQSDLVERESLFQRLAADRSLLQKQNVVNYDRASQLQDQLTRLQQDYDALQLRLGEKDVELNGLSRMLDEADQRCRQLTADLGHQSTLDRAKIDELEKHVESLQLVESHNTDLDVELKRANQLLFEASEQRSGLEASLITANEEKAILDAYMSELKGNLTKVDERLLSLKVELTVKSDELNALKAVNNQLMEENSQLKDRLNDSVGVNQQLGQQLQAAHSNMANLQWQCGQLQSNLDSIHSAVGNTSRAIESIKHANGSLDSPGYVDQVEQKTNLQDSIQAYFQPTNESNQSRDDFFSTPVDNGGIKKESITPCFASPLQSESGQQQPAPDSITLAIQAMASETSSALSSLTATRQSADRHAAAARRESEARKCEVEAHRSTREELELVRDQVTQLQAELTKARLEVSEAMTIRQSSTSTDELETLKALIKTTTDRLTVTSQELAEANREKMTYQSQLADLRGALRAHVEQQHQATAPYPGDDDLLTHPSSLACTLPELAQLIGGGGFALPLDESKPLSGLNKCFTNLQQEIAALEAEVVDHTLAVRDALPSTSVYSNASQFV